MNGVKLKPPEEEVLSAPSLEVASLVEPKSRLVEVRRLLVLALPVMVANLGHVLMGVVDVLMVGHVGELALGAVALGNIYCFSFFVLGLGFLLGLDPVISQAYGAKKWKECGLGLQRGYLLGLALAVPNILWLMASGWVLSLLGQPPEVVALASSYVWAILPSVVFSYLFVASRQFVQSLGRMKPVMVVVLSANVINVVANYLFIFGHGGMPALGAVGAGLASSLSRFYMCLALVAYVAWGPDFQKYPRFPSREALEWKGLKKLVAFGLPVGIQLGLEVWVFSVAAVWMGWMGPRYLAAHQISINLVAVVFMLPLGLSQAACVRVGHAFGRGEYDQVRRVWEAALAVIVVQAVVSSLAFFWFPQSLAGLYSSDLGLVAAVASLLPVAAVFLAVDGLQVVGGGVLRGAGDTSAPMVFNLLGHWLVGVPSGYLLAFGLGWGSVGVWWGMALGLASVAALMVYRVHSHLLKGHRARG